MYNEEEIADSLEFCKTAKEYYTDFGDDEPEDERRRRAEHNALLDAGYSRATDKGWRRPTSESRGLRAIYNILVLAVCVFLAYVIASVTTRYVAHQTWVEGDSMEPTLSDGDSIIIEKVSYYFGNPGRYDVVVFPVTGMDQQGNSIDTYYVKRVIGLPGETVQIVNGRVNIDGEELSDDRYCLSEILDSGNAAEPVTLGEDEYFVLGDNRNMSTDSRSDFVGLVRRRDIVGEVFLRVWPISDFGLIRGVVESPAS